MTNPVSGPRTITAPASPSLAGAPTVGHWLGIGADGRITIRTGKAELGQGLHAALAQIAADAFGIATTDVEVIGPGTDRSADEGLTAGSLSIQHSGAAIAQAASRARQQIIAAAAARLDCKVSEITLSGGMAIGPDGALQLAELASDIDTSKTVAVDGQAPIFLGEHAGASSPRTEIGDLLAGRPRFIHDLNPPDVLHVRVVRPPTTGSRLIGDVPDVAGVDMTRHGDVLFVAADEEATTVAGAARLAARLTWSTPGPPNGTDDWSAHLLSLDADEEQVSVGDGRRPGQITARYERGLIAHASIAPSCALAAEVDGQLTVLTHSQGVFPLRAALASTLGRDEATIIVRHVPGAGCYGHNPADDAAYDAALAALDHPGRTVRVLWSREDELAYDPFGPGMVADLAADLDGDRLARLSLTVTSSGHSSRPRPGPEPSFLTARQIDGLQPATPVDPPMATGGGSGRNAVPGYDITADVLVRRVRNPGVRTSALRSLGATFNVFAIESFVDELADATGVDPLAFRLNMLSDARARAVLAAAADASGWGQPMPEGWGRGLGYARYKSVGGYCAVVADVEITDRLHVRHLTLAADVGRIVHRDGTINQLEGGAIQATSWALLEQVRFGADGVIGRDWETYPILRFSDVPSVDVVLVEPADVPPVGAGEAASGPTTAAIGNALAAALGVRVRRLPLTPETITAAISEEQ